MDMKKNDKITIRKSFILSYLIPGIILTILLVVGLTLLSIYSKFRNRVVLIVAIVFILSFSALYAAATVIGYFRMKKIYYDGLYRTTSILLRSLKNNVATDARYPDSKIVELQDLNEDLDEVNVVTMNSTLISQDLQNAYIPLVYISEEDKIVTLDSFKKELRALIYCSQNFRNTIVEIFYDLDEDVLTSEEGKRVVDVLKLAFSEYENYLFIPNDNGTGYYMFLPRIDSFSFVSERLNEAMRNLSITKKTFDGLVTLPVRFSIVCYPYSDISEIFSDLMFAKRQGLPFNLYLPNRLKALSESRTLQNSLNLNNMSRILEHLTDLKVSSRERNESYKIIRNTLSSVMTFLDIDWAGIILYDEVNSRYFSQLHITSSKEILFQEQQSVDKGFINALEIVKDKDDSFYFSTRRHAGFQLARYLDKANISGGFYYLLHDNSGSVLGVVYFLNKIKPLMIDSYIRESLFILSYRIGDFLSVAHEEDKVVDTYKEINNVLMSSDIALYRIDIHDYELKSYSYHFSSLFPKAEAGQKCYKALYGLDAPCNGCPLKTSKKMLSDIRGGKIETSLTANESKNQLVRMIVKPLKNEFDGGDRFDKDLLINSYYSLALSLGDLYTVNARGYLLVLRVDNHDKLLNEAGSEGYLFLLRQLIGRIKSLKVMNSNIFHYATQAIAILMPEVGQVDIMNFIEKIYDVSKEKYQFNGSDYSFNITYLPYTFPQQYPTSEDFLKSALRHYNSLAYQINKDMITLPDSDYTRSASRTEFMLAVIDDQFGNKTFTVALQPFVKTIDQSIFGAELLIRLSDNYRNSVFNADELIKVAGKNGKISLISNALINYIGELYKQYGLSVFKLSGFQRITMNTDYSFFDDPDFFQTLYDSFTKYSFTKYFLGFEITEKEIYSHLTDFKKITKGILNHHINLICDQYSGEFLSMDILKELGFSEIKIGRYLVGDIEVNPKHLNAITSIDQLAKQNDLRVTFVGVENFEQFTLLKDMDKNCMIQGYYFYRPLEDYRLIDELRKNR